MGAKLEHTQSTPVPRQGVRSPRDTSAHLLHLKNGGCTATEPRPHARSMKLYFEAEPFLRDGERGLKTRIFSAKLASAPKHIYALVISALKYKEYIQEIVRKARLREAPALRRLKVSEALLALLVYDFLFSAKGRIQLGKHPVKDAFLAHKTRMHAELTRLKLRHRVRCVADLPMRAGLDDDETPVRWMRINSIRIGAEAFFQKHPFFAALRPVASLAELTAPGVIYKDPYIQNLYGLHPREKLTTTAAYLHGEAIIQDRASCFPGAIMFDGPHGHHTQIIDATAAPGNKTTHAAALVARGNHQAEPGVVFAFERDARRVKVLKTMCEKATGKLRKALIHPTHADFTTVLPQDFPEVSGLLVDPSCSGSGIFGRAVEDAHEQGAEDVDTARLQKLAAFQFTITKHALAFPGARRVVYSTCSIHPHENERVVVDLLRDPAVQAQGWRLAPREQVIALWPRRGWKEEFTALCEGDDDERCVELAGGCVRSVPKEDGGIGFFAACFVRETQPEC